MQKEDITKQFRFTGRVQGVGFRYTAVQCSAGLALRGFVRNLPDGSVEIVAHGSDADLDELLRRLNERMGDNIARTEVSLYEHDKDTFENNKLPDPFQIQR